jgi:hypothetical protein
MNLCLCLFCHVGTWSLITARVETSGYTRLAKDFEELYDLIGEAFNRTVF